MERVRRNNSNFVGKLYSKWRWTDGIMKDAYWIFPPEISCSQDELLEEDVLYFSSCLSLQANTNPSTCQEGKNLNTFRTIQVNG